MLVVEPHLEERLASQAKQVSELKRLELLRDAVMSTERRINGTLLMSKEKELAQEKKELNFARAQQQRADTEVSSSLINFEAVQKHFPLRK